MESRSNSNWDNDAASQGNRMVEQRAALDTLKKIEYLQQEVMELRGKVEEQNYQLQQMQEHQKKLYLDLDRRLRESGPAKTSGASLSEDETKTNSIQSNLDAYASNRLAVTETAGLPAQENEQAEEKIYQSAYRLIQNKDYEGALAGFKSLTSSYPNGKYVPNADYWLGEIYLVKGELNLAYEAFDRVCRNHPQHPKAADSLLKLGYV
ncbi:MAG TPA: YbgF trimerization domain-containing protein, partial [Candidatus Berkiella sp.]|nr:YbgF trimerization domain-containing protein [Candidatus Berkiella sp.]